MSPLQQYGLLLAFILSTVGLVFVLQRIARSIRTTQPEPGKEVPYTGGTPAPEPVWVNYHVRYYGFALLFLAFDMEMAYMYPWAVVFREIGLSALLDMSVFLTILFLGILYGWREGALQRQ